MDTRAEMLAAYEMPPPTALCNLGARRSTTPLRLSRLSAGHCANEAEPAPASKGLFRSLPDMRIPPYRGGRHPDEFATVFASRSSWLSLTQQDINPSTPPESPRQQRRTPYDSLNFGSHVGDEHAAVLRNRQHLVQDLQLPNEPVWLDQVHGKDLLQIGNDFHHSDETQADGAYRREAGAVQAGSRSWAGRGRPALGTCA